MLGHVPFVKSLPADGALFESERHSPYAEAMRRLRTNLMFVDVTTGRHAFVVTSPTPGEGKTLTALNLALAMADTGTRVLLMDADLRKPSVATCMGLVGDVGLTTVLLGRIPATEAVQQWHDSSLFVLPAGQIPPNPSELLGSEAMEEVFAKLLHEYDFILLDSPPVIPVIDPVVLDKYTGGMLMVLAADRTRKRDLAAALKALETVQVKVSGFALNMLAAKSPGAYDYHYRYRQYGPPAKDQPQPEPRRRGRRHQHVGGTSES